MKKRTKKELPLIKKAPSKPLISKKQRFKFFNRFYFNIYPSNFDTHKILKPIDKEILSIIFTFGIQGKQFYVSNKQLANQLNVGKSTIKRSLKKLKDKNFIDYAYKKINNRITHRYITKFNFKKALGKPNKELTNNTLNSHKSSKPTKSKTSKHKSHKINKFSKKTQKPLSTNQKQQINKAIHIIGRNVTSYNPKHLKNHFISEYQHGNLNFSNLDDALTIYQYNKIKHKSIKSSVGYICAITTKNINKNKVNKMMKENKKHQSNQKDNKYLINGEPFLKADLQTFKKDIRHKLKEQKITKKQYKYYWNEYYKHGNRYGDWL